MNNPFLPRRVIFFFPKMKKETDAFAAPIAVSRGIVNGQPAAHAGWAVRATFDHLQQA